MDSKQTMHANHGEGETSYARNSTFQSAEQNRMKPLIEQAITALCAAATPLPHSMVIADLGCSSGPNALALVSTAVDAIRRHCAQHEQQPPELCVLLNDLPENDFNSVAKSLAAFKQGHESFALQIVTGIVPGSFYKRLFTCESLYLVLSSNSLQWISKAPEDLEKSRIPVYDSDEHLRRARRPIVLEAYGRQFRKDFTQFLNFRAQEMIPGGQMVLSLAGRVFNGHASQSNLPWELVAFALNDMASRGVVNRDNCDTFYIPVYGPFDTELREIIEDQGSFEINQMQVDEPMSGMDKGLITPRVVAHWFRAVFEPIILQHFGSSGQVTEELVKTLERYLGSKNLEDVAADIIPIVFLGVWLTRRI